MPGAGAGSRLDPGVGPCLPPGRPVGSCQCRSGLRLLKAPLLPTAPWGTNPEWQVRTEMGGGIDNEGPKGPMFWIHRPATCKVTLHRLQASTDGTLCPYLRAQLCRVWGGRREGQSHHRTQLLREEHLPQTGRQAPALPPPSSPSPASQAPQAPTALPHCALTPHAMNRLTPAVPLPAAFSFST